MLSRKYMMESTIIMWFAACVVLAVCSMQGCVSGPTQPTTAPTVVPAPSPEMTSPPPKAVQIDAMIEQSACAKYQFKDRGRAPLGFLKGVARVYAGEVCNKAKAKPLGDQSHDALAAYSIEPTLINTYTLLIGLALRESSGKYYEGRDASAGAEAPSETEAGLFQVSANSLSADPELRKLMSYYQAHGDECLAPTFKEGVGEHMSQNYGSGEALAFQKLQKECPAFAVKYAATLVRVLRKHFGPINRKEAEINPSCALMLQQASQAVCP